MVPNGANDIGWPAYLMLYLLELKMSFLEHYSNRGGGLNSGLKRGRIALANWLNAQLLIE